MSARYFWVYLPDVDEAGCVVQAASFEDAFHEGLSMLEPDQEVKVQVYELGEGQEFYYSPEFYYNPEEDDDA